MIYLDNAASSQICEDALAAFEDACRTTWGNPSSGHAPGRAAGALLEQSRRTVAAALGASPESLVFTSGGTESVNLALRGAAAAYGRQKKHIVATTLEHAAVSETLKTLQTAGFLITEVSPGPDGCVGPESVCRAVREDTFLVCAPQVCAETGAVLDMEKLYRAVKAKNPHCLVFADGAQGFLKMCNSQPAAHNSSPFDLYSLSGHKIHAPRGVGALYVKNGIRILPQMTGGGQENGLRAGTEPTALCAALAAAVKAWRPAEKGLMEALLEGLTGENGGTPRAKPDCVVIPGHSEYIMSVAFPGVRGEVLQRALSDGGVCVGVGSACSRGKRSRALLSMNLPPDVVDGAVRLSVSRFCGRAQIEEALPIIQKTVERLR